MSIRFVTAELASPAAAAAAPVVSVRAPAPRSDAGPNPAPAVGDVRGEMGDDARRRSTAKGLLVFAVSATAYALGLAGFLLLDGWLPKAVAAALFAVSLPMLFIVGHDACHQSLTPHRWLNKVIGRLTMVLTWHAYSVWDLGHNGLHHAWTNVRGKDFTWTPLSPQEYAALSPLGRWMQRQYRTVYGLGFYYLIEIWTKYGMTGAKAPTPRMNALFWADRASIVAFTALLVTATLRFTDRSGLTTPFGDDACFLSAGLLLLGVVLPFLAWHWVMSAIVLVHHTHPTIPWYGDVADWSYYAGQVQSTIHVELPRPVELILHHIMEHTAHHADPRVPLYNLEKAQKHLEDAYAADITIIPFTLGGFFQTLRTCRLFDYTQHRWLDWDGTPTTPPLLKR